MSLNQKKRPLPPGWRWARLGEVCHINPSRPQGFSRASNAPTTFVPMATVDEDCGIVAAEVRNYSQVAKGYTYFQEGDVLFAKITPCMENGKSAIATGLLDGIGFGSTEFHVLRPGPSILAEWVYLFVRQPIFRSEAARYFTGAVGQQRVPEEFVDRSFIPLPPVSEQRRIAARLTEQMAQVEKMRQAAKAQVEAARALPAGFLRGVFESEEAKSWPRRSLGDMVADMQAGLARGEKSKAEGVPHLRMNNISTAGHIDLSLIWRVPLSEQEITKYQLRPGDVLFNNTNSAELVGKTALFDIVDGTYIYSNHLTRLRCQASSLDPAWLTAYLRHLWQQRLFERICDRWIGQVAVQRQKLVQLSIPIPPLDEQKHITAHLSEQMAHAQKLLKTAQTQLEAVIALPGALLEEVFGGFEPAEAL